MGQVQLIRTARAQKCAQHTALVSTNTQSAMWAKCERELLLVCVSLGLIRGMPTGPHSIKTLFC